ncbi:MAG: phosphate ABC transporter permease subunit PstC [Ignavibacteria bacterium]|nr:phosphate ABC transporter permease subunit PstC [Ignavibacteria bacterium]
MDEQFKNELLKKRFYFSDWLARIVITLVSIVSFISIALIFVFVFREALPILNYTPEVETYTDEELQMQVYNDLNNQIEKKEEKLSNTKEQIEITPRNDDQIKLQSVWESVFSTVWDPISKNPRYGIIPLIVGSLKVTLIAILIAAPIAILAALFTSTFAPKWAKEILKPAIEILAGFPSVVIGFFALVVLATFLQNLFGYQYRLNAFVGGLALSLAVIPIIYTVTEDALSAIPKSYIEASIALGAEKWQTAIYVVLPAAAPGIFAAVLLGIGRAFGETMIVMMATGNAPIISASIFEPVRTMSATIGAEMAEVIFGELHYNVLFLLGSILFLFSFSLNAIAEFYIRNRLLRRIGGSK